jgi:hypothetical protein
LEFSFLFLKAVASVLWRVGKPSVLLSFGGLVLTLAQPWDVLPFAPEIHWEASLLKGLLRISTTTCVKTDSIPKEVDLLRKG